MKLNFIDSLFLKNYDFTKKSIQQIAFHYSNLQPLWTQDNNLKSDNILTNDAEVRISHIRELALSKF